MNHVLLSKVLKIETYVNLRHVDNDYKIEQMQCSF